MSFKKGIGRYFGQVVGIAVITLLGLMILAIPVLAVADPDSVSIEEIHANRNLRETGDAHILVHYNVAYAAPPNNPIDEVFTFRLMDTDGETELGASLAYPYNDDGYGQGVVSFYFDASDALTWGQDYYIRIIGNPTQFADPPVYDFEMQSSDWTSLTGSGDNKDDLADKILEIARDLEVAWAVTLLDQTETGTVLASAGEAYFRNAINGLQVLAPSVFLVQVGDPEYTARSWATTQANAYETRFQGTWVQTAIGDVADLFTVDWHMIGGLFVMAGCIAVVALAQQRSQSVNSGLVCALAIFLCGGVMGWTPMAIVGITSIMCALYVGYWFFFSRAT